MRGRAAHNPTTTTSRRLPPARLQTTRDRIIEVSDGGALCALAATIGIRGIVVKRSRLLLWQSVRIHLDEVEQLGTFIELEIVAPLDSDLTHKHRLVADICDALEITDERLVALGYAEQLLGATSTP